MINYDLTGQRFSRLTVIEPAGSRNKKRLWRCYCDCGNETIVKTHNLLHGGVKSCGCLVRETSKINGENSHIGERSKTHGESKSKLYRVWNGIKSRCTNPNSSHYNYYGGRGICMCEEWKTYENFRDWAVATGYAEGMSIERIDVNGNYCPENCKWIPLNEQPKNRRNAVRLKYNGKEYTVGEIAEITGLKERTIRGRYERGWSVEDMFITSKFNNKYDSEEARLNL